MFKFAEQLVNDVLQEKIESLKDLLKIQCTDGNWNYDPYMMGLGNGMILSLGILEDKSPEFLDAPIKWKKNSNIFQAPTIDELTQRLINSFLKNADGSYDVEEYLNRDDVAKLVKNGKFVIKFRNVFDFNCNNLGLTSLEGAPEYVSGTFNCQWNKLTTLEGSPEIVNGDFICSHNNITTLKSSPKYIKKDFDCGWNKLTNLEGCPKRVDGDFFIQHNNKVFRASEIRDVCEVDGLVLTMKKDKFFYSDESKFGEDK